jgi:hypothetical protein
VTINTLTVLTSRHSIFTLKNGFGTSASQATETQPHDVLPQALNDFKAGLTADELHRFQQIIGSNAAAPDASSVMLLVSQIDAEKAGKFSRCIGPRLTPFLEVVEQFSSIVQTFVSSNPTIAALIWGGVKVALLITSNFSGYFEKLADVFVDLGRSFPQFKEFASLYSTSKRLQDALCLYFATVVHLCSKSLQASRRSAFIHFTKAAIVPFEREFGPLQSELGKLCQNVRNEITLAASTLQIQEARLQTLERDDSSIFRSRLLKLDADARKELEDLRLWRTQEEARRLRKEIKNNLCLLDHTSAWKRARKQCLQGTTTWLKTKDHFLRWYEKASPSSVLWFSGNIGTGKTIVSSSVIAHLHLDRSPSDVVSYFFCRGEETASLFARNIIGSIARQALDQIIERLPSDALRLLHEETSSLDIDGVVSFVTERLEINKTYYIVLDGVNKCDYEQLHATLEALKSLLRNSPKNRQIKFFVAGRSEIGQMIRTYLEPSYHIHLTGADNNQDIVRFVEATLDRKLELGELLLLDPELIIKIEEFLVAGSDGM